MTFETLRTDTDGVVAFEQERGLKCMKSRCRNAEPGPIFSPSD
jgi:hypothetical protein